MHDHLDTLIQHIEEWRTSHAMLQDDHGHLLLMTDSVDFHNLFLDPSNSEKVMIATRCPKFEHSVQKPLPNVPVHEAQTIKLGDASVIFSVEPLKD